MTWITRHSYHQRRRRSLDADGFKGILRLEFEGYGTFAVHDLVSNVVPLIEEALNKVEHGHPRIQVTMSPTDVWVDIEPR